MESSNKQQEVNYTAVLVVYLIGLFLGGLYVGMVSPVRTVVQEAFGIGDTIGIWMITIYTLFYAAFIPVIGKIADRSGRKRVFLWCLALFAAGSLVCWGAATSTSLKGMPALGGIPLGFMALLVGRIVQAIGACGMIPVANAEIGASFPDEKRGMALGIAAAVAGIANVAGAGTGSAVLAVVGNDNWGLLFLGAVPLCLIVAAVGKGVLPQSQLQKGKPLDVKGSALFVGFVLFLLLTLLNLDYASLPASLITPGVGGCLACAVLCALLFALVEKRAADPVFHLEYLRSRPIVITMVMSFFVGCTIITMTLVPEYAEFALNLRAGEGGYYVVAVGVFSMFGPPFAGKLIDKVGVKPVMTFGLVVSALAFVFLAYAVPASPTPLTMVVGMCIMGLGMGFTMGAPTNYMILENTSKQESGAAIGTIALVRQIGTTVAPAILVGFIGAGQLAGYQSMLLCVVVFNAASLLLLLAYRPSPKQ